MAALKFRFLPHPSDVGIIALGSTPKEIFENAALGMFSLIGDLKKVKKKLRLEVKIEADNLDSLLINWLNELLYLFDSRQIIFSEFTVTRLTKNILGAEVFGEKVDKEKHALYKSIKAATYNQLKIDENQATIIFDV